MGTARYKILLCVALGLSTLVSLAGSEQFDQASQDSRQPDIGLEGLRCGNPCELGGPCSGDSCGALLTRSILTNETSDSYDEDTDPDNWLSLIKSRLQGRSSSNRGLVPERRLTNAKAATYVIKRLFLGEGEEGQAPPDQLISEAPVPKAFARQAVFQRGAEAKFEWGMRGLHGCTVLAVVSRRAVYMAHFWETYSTHNDDDISGVGRRQYQERVIDAMWVKEVRHPYQPEEATNEKSTPKEIRNNAYAVPEGPALDRRLFNRVDDRTDVFIMTPMDNDGQDIKYRNKINLLKESLLQALYNPDATDEDKLQIIEYAYKRLNYGISEDGSPQVNPGFFTDFQELKHPKRAAGYTLFQYDGEGEWRLFFEDKWYDGPRKPKGKT